MKTSSKGEKNGRVREGSRPGRRVDRGAGMVMYERDERTAASGSDGPFCLRRR